MVFGEATQSDSLSRGIHSLRRMSRTRSCRLSAMLTFVVAGACSGPLPLKAEAERDPAELNVSEAVAEFVNGATAPALAMLIRSSRDLALQDGARPLPKHVRRAMQPYFESELLDEVRWTTSSARPGIDTLLAGSLEYEGAVTLDHVIVFFDDAGAQNPELWVHELNHVRQYRQLGVDGFARAYVARWHHMERQAEARSNQLIARFLRARADRSPGQDRHAGLAHQSHPVAARPT